MENLTTVVASTSAGFEQMQLTKEFDYADKKTEKLPSWPGGIWAELGPNVCRRRVVCL